MLTLFLAGGCSGGPPKVARLRQQSEGLSGYIAMTVPNYPPEYGFGVSLYVPAWPLLERPLRDFEMGLPGIWIEPDNRDVEYPLLPAGTETRDDRNEFAGFGPSYRDAFQTIEGSLGFWASTRFGSVTPKYRMNGTPDGYNHLISSPGWGFGETTALKADDMGIAQLSLRLLVPPDGLPMRDGTRGELFGYAWMALPLIAAKTNTTGQPVPTGDQSWTLFINAQNFKGPLAFYTPRTWSLLSQRYPPATGRGLDVRSGLITSTAMELHPTPCFIAEDTRGRRYMRVPRLQFPVDDRGCTVLVRNLTAYSKDALYRQVEKWTAGGNPASGKFDGKKALVLSGVTEPFSLSQGANGTASVRGFEKWAATAMFDSNTFGLQWRPDAAESWTGPWRRGVLPEYYRQEGTNWVAITAGEAPDETGLKLARFVPALTDSIYASPTAARSVWKKPGPKAGPFRARLSDGTVVTYWWYRFIDQPALQEAGLSDAEKERLQKIAEEIHRHWTMDKEYLPPPGMGTLATLDPALIVTPPQGLEIGYVPIVTRQEKAR